MASLLRTLVFATVAALAGCDTVSQDFDDLIESFSPPSPFQAAVWASDFNHPGLQRRGVVLLSNSYFGGSEANVRLFRVLVEENADPLVRAAAIQALGRWGEPADAEVIAARLESPVELVRLEAAKALQRLHNDAVAGLIWRRLVDDDEAEPVRVELAIAMGQYPGDAGFQALVRALDDRRLALNLAAVDSLRLLTGQDFGLAATKWIEWYDSTRDPFAGEMTFIYPTFQRKVSFLERLMFWVPVRFEDPAVPRGLGSGVRETYGNDEPPAAAGEGP